MSQRQYVPKLSDKHDLSLSMLRDYNRNVKGILEQSPPKNDLKKEFTSPLPLPFLTPDRRVRPKLTFVEDDEADPHPDYQLADDLESDAGPFYDRSMLEQMKTDNTVLMKQVQRMQVEIEKQNNAIQGKNAEIEELYDALHTIQQRGGNIDYDRMRSEFENTLQHERSLFEIDLLSRDKRIMELREQLEQFAQEHGNDGKQDALENDLTQTEQALREVESRLELELEQKRIVIMKLEEADRSAEQSKHEFESLQKRLNEALTNLEQSQSAEVEQKKKLIDTLAELKQSQAKLQELEASQKSGLDEKIGQLEKQLNSIKQHYETRLQETRAQYEATIAEINHHHEIQLEQLREQYEILKSDTITQLEGHIPLKQVEVQINNIKQQYETRINDLKESMTEIRHNYEAQQQSMRQHYEAFKSETLSRSENLIPITQHEQQIFEFKKNTETRMSEIKQNHEVQMQGQKQHYESILAELKSNNDTRIQELKQNNEQMTRSKEQQFESQVNEMKQHHEMRINELKQNFESRFQDSKQMQKTKLEQMKQLFDSKCLEMMTINARLLRENEVNMQDLIKIRSNADNLSLHLASLANEHATIHQEVDQCEELMVLQSKELLDVALRQPDEIESYKQQMQMCERVRQAAQEALDSLERDFNEQAKQRIVLEQKVAQLSQERANLQSSGDPRSELIRVREELRKSNATRKLLEQELYASHQSSLQANENTALLKIQLESAEKKLAQLSRRHDSAIQDKRVATEAYANQIHALQGEFYTRYGRRKE